VQQDSIKTKKVIRAQVAKLVRLDITIRLLDQVDVRLVQRESNLSQPQVPAHPVLVANTNIKTMRRLPLANIVKLEKNSIRRQRRVNPVQVANTTSHL